MTPVLAERGWQGGAIVLPVDRETARSKLDEVAREREAARAVFEEVDERLRDAIRDADAVGISHVEIARRSGVHAPAYAGTPSAGYSGTLVAATRVSRARRCL